MKRRKNPELPEYLRDVETALDKALKKHWMDELPESVKSYQTIIDFINQSGDKLDESDEDEYGLAEQHYKAASVLENAEQYIDRMLDFEEADEVELFRKLMVKPGDEIRMGGVGIFWANEEDCAEAHWGVSGGIKHTLHGVVRPESIDWEGSFNAFLMVGDEECEVKLIEGAPVTIIAIDGEELDPPIEATT